MQRPAIKAYPELEKFIQLYWNRGVVQAGADFVEELKRFRDDALSTPETRHMFKRACSAAEGGGGAGFHPREDFARDVGGALGTKPVSDRPQ